MSMLQRYSQKPSSLHQHRMYETLLHKVHNKNEGKTKRMSKLQDSTLPDSQDAATYTKTLFES